MLPVVIRIRPDEVSQLPHTNSTIDVNNQHFTFDNIYSKTTNPLLFNNVKELTDAFIAGYNATLLAYGQTGAGKSFAMGTIPSNSQDGLIQDSTRYLFQNLALSTNTTLSCSFLEVYNEDLKDLLEEKSTGMFHFPNFLSAPGVVLREDKGLVFPTNMKDVNVKTPEDVFKLLNKGLEHRSTSSTELNYNSSRSHAIFTLSLSQNIWVKEVDGNGGHWKSLKSRFNFVDLAGSERLKRTGSTGERQKEGISINSGLSALGNVIHALSDGSPHVPYRESKLTRLLQDSLGGNSQTLMLACISPLENDIQETLNTLRYASRTRNIKNSPVINANLEYDNEMARLKDQIKKLQLDHEKWKNTDNVSSKENADLKSKVNELTIALEKSTTEKLLQTESLLWETHSEADSDLVSVTESVNSKTASSIPIAVNRIPGTRRNSFSKIEIDSTVLGRGKSRIFNQMSYLQQLETLESQLKTAQKLNSDYFVQIQEQSQKLGLLVDREANSDAYISELEERLEKSTNVLLKDTELIHSLKLKIAQLEESHKNNEDYIVGLESELSKQDSLLEVVEKLELELAESQERNQSSSPNNEPDSLLSITNLESWLSSFTAKLDKIIDIDYLSPTSESLRDLKSDLASLISESMAYSPSETDDTTSMASTAFTNRDLRQSELEKQLSQLEDRYQQDFSTWDREKQDLKKVIEGLESRVEGLNEDLTHSHHHHQIVDGGSVDEMNLLLLEQMRGELDEAEVEKAKLNEDFDALDADYLELQTECEELIAVKADLVADNADLVADKAELEAVIQEAKKEHENQVTGWGVERDRLKGEVLRLEGRFADRSKDFEAKEVDIRTLTDDKKGLLKLVDDLTLKFSDLVKVCEAKDIDIRTLSDDKADLLKEVDDLTLKSEAVIQEAKKEHENQVTDWGVEKDGLNGEVLRLEERLAEISKYCEAKDIEIRTLTEDKADLLKEVDNLKLKSSDLQKLLWNREKELESEMLEVSRFQEYLATNAKVIDERDMTISSMKDEKTDIVEQLRVLSSKNADLEKIINQKDEKFDLEFTGQSRSPFGYSKRQSSLDSYTGDGSLSSPSLSPKFSSQSLTLLNSELDKNSIVLELSTLKKSLKETKEILEVRTVESEMLRESFNEQEAFFVSEIDLLKAKIDLLTASNSSLESALVKPSVSEKQISTEIEVDAAQPIEWVADRGFNMIENNDTETQTFSNERIDSGVQYDDLVELLDIDTQTSFPVAKVDFGANVDLNSYKLDSSNLEAFMQENEMLKLTLNEMRFKSENVQDAQVQASVSTEDIETQISPISKDSATQIESPIFKSSELQTESLELLDSTTQFVLDSTEASTHVDFTSSVKEENLSLQSMFADLEIRFHAVEEDLKCSLSFAELQTDSLKESYKTQSLLNKEIEELEKRLANSKVENNIEMRSSRVGGNEFGERTSSRGIVFENENNVKRSNQCGQNVNTDHVEFAKPKPKQRHVQLQTRSVKTKEISLQTDNLIEVVQSRDIGEFNGGPNVQIIDQLDRIRNVLVQQEYHTRISKLSLVFDVADDLKGSLYNADSLKDELKAIEIDEIDIHLDQTSSTDVLNSFQIDVGVQVKVLNADASIQPDQPFNRDIATHHDQVVSVDNACQIEREINDFGIQVEFSDNSALELENNRLSVSLMELQSNYDSLTTEIRRLKSSETSQQSTRTVLPSNEVVVTTVTTEIITEETEEVDTVDASVQPDQPFNRAIATNCDQVVSVDNACQIEREINDFGIQVEFSDNSVLELENNRLSISLMELQSNYDSLTTEIRRNKSEISQTSRSVVSSNEVVLETVTPNVVSGNANDWVTQLKFDKLMNEKNSLVESNQQLMRSREEQVEKMNKLDSKLESSDELNRRLKSDLELKTNAFSNLTDELNVCKSELETFQKKIKGLQSKKTHMLDYHGRSVEKDVVKNSNEPSTIRSMWMKLDKLETVKLQQTNTIRKLEENLKDARQVDRDFTLTQRSASLVQTEAESLRDELDFKTKDHDRVNKELYNIQGELERERRLSDSLKMSNSNSMHEISQLSSKINDLQDLSSLKIRELESSQKKFQEISLQLAAEKNLSTNSNSSLNEILADKSKLVNRINEIESLLQLRSTELESVHSELRNRSLELDEEKKITADFRNGERDVVSKFLSANDRKRSLENHLNTNRFELDSLAKDLATALNSLEISNAELRTLQNSKNVYEQSISKSRNSEVGGSDVWLYQVEGLQIELEVERMENLKQATLVQEFQFTINNLNNNCQAKDLEIQRLKKMDDRLRNSRAINTEPIGAGKLIVELKAQIRKKDVDLLKFQDENLRLRKRITPGGNRSLVQIVEESPVDVAEKKFAAEKIDLENHVDRLQSGCANLQETVGSQEAQINQLQLEIHRLENKTTILVETGVGENRIDDEHQSASPNHKFRGIVGRTITADPPIQDMASAVRVVQMHSLRNRIIELEEQIAVMNLSSSRKQSIHRPSPYQWGDIYIETQPGRTSIDNSDIQKNVDEVLPAVKFNERADGQRWGFSKKRSAYLKGLQADPDATANNSFRNQSVDASTQCYQQSPMFYNDRPSEEVQVDDSKTRNISNLGNDVHAKCLADRTKLVQRIDILTWQLDGLNNEKDNRKSKRGGGWFRWRDRGSNEDAEEEPSKVSRSLTIAQQVENNQSTNVQTSQTVTAQPIQQNQSRQCQSGSMQIQQSNQPSSQQSITSHQTEYDQITQPRKVSRPSPERTSIHVTRSMSSEQSTKPLPTIPLKSSGKTVKKGRKSFGGFSMTDIYNGGGAAYN